MSRALEHGLDSGSAGDRYQVVLHIDAPVLADPDQPGASVLEDGPHVPAGTSRRLACDASRVMMQHDAAGNVLDVGRRARTIPPALRRALTHRDRGCRFPGCGVRVCQGHHLQHCVNGVPTRLDNLALLSAGVTTGRSTRRATRWRELRTADSTSGGRTAGRCSRFRRRSLADPVDTLMAQHQAQGLWIHPRTGCPSWQGSCSTSAGRSTCSIR